MISRYHIIRIHMFLAAFLLPTALLYFTGGALYTLDYKGHVSKKTIPLILDQPLKPDIEYLTQLCKKELSQRNLALPDGAPVLRSKKNATYTFIWSDLKQSVTVKFGKKSSHVSLIYRERSILTQIMRVHRAEAGKWFELLSLTLAGGMVIVLLTGIYMGLSSASFRRPILLMIACGIGTTVMLVVMHY